MLERSPQPQDLDATNEKVINLARWCAERHGDYTRIEGGFGDVQSLPPDQEVSISLPFEQLFAGIDQQVFAKQPNTHDRWAAYLGPIGQELKVWEYPQLEEFLREVEAAPTVRGNVAPFEVWQHRLPPHISPESMVIRFIKNGAGRAQHLTELLAADLPAMLGFSQRDRQSAAVLVHNWPVQYPELTERLTSVAALYRTGLYPDNEGVRQFVDSLAQTEHVTYTVDPDKAVAELTPTW